MMDEMTVAMKAVMRVWKKVATKVGKKVEL